MEQFQYRLYGLRNIMPSKIIKLCSVVRKSIESLENIYEAVSAYHHIYNKFT